MSPSPRLKTQRARLLAILVEARGGWVSLPEILALGIAQFGARILEMRRTGFDIENRTERDDAGVVHSWYRLINSPAVETPKPKAHEVALLAPADRPSPRDWYTRATGKVRPSVAHEELFLFDRASGVSRG